MDEFSEFHTFLEDLRKRLNERMEQEKAAGTWKPAYDPTEKHLDASQQRAAYMASVEEQIKQMHAEERKRKQEHLAELLQNADEETLDKLTKELEPEPVPTLPEEWGTLSKSWVRLPLALLQLPDLSETDVILTAYLIDQLQDVPDKTGLFSLPKLSQKINTPLRSLKRSLTKLESLNLIEKAQTGRKLMIALTGADKILNPKKRGGKQT